MSIYCDRPLEPNCDTCLKYDINDCTITSVALSVGLDPNTDYIVFAAVDKFDEFFTTNITTDSHGDIAFNLNDLFQNIFSPYSGSVVFWITDVNQREVMYLTTRNGNGYCIQVEYTG